MKPSFVEMVTLGRSLVVVQTKLEMELLKHALAKQVLLPVLYADAVPTIEATLVEFQTSRIFKNYGVLVINQASCNGFKVTVDRVVWIGFVPDDASMMVRNYRQAMARGDTEYGQAAKWHYTVKELP